MRKILALDLAEKRTGFAIGSPDDDPVFGSHGLPSTGPDIGRMLVAFDAWLRLRIQGEDVALCVFEAPILTAGRTHILTARKLMNLAGHTEFVCAQADIRCVEQNIATNKKQFTGRGDADKDMMITVARRYGWDVQNSDEADACALWVGAVCTYAKAHAGRFQMGPLGARPRRAA